MRNGSGSGGRNVAIAGLVAAVVASLATFGMVWAAQPEGNGPREWTARGVVMIFVVFGMPPLLALAGCVTRGRPASLSRLASAGLFVLAFAFFGVSFGLFLIPAVLMGVSAGLAHFTALTARQPMQSRGTEGQ